MRSVLLLPPAGVGDAGAPSSMSSLGVVAAISSKTLVAAEPDRQSRTRVAGRVEAALCLAVLSGAVADPSIGRQKRGWWKQPAPLILPTPRVQTNGPMCFAVIDGAGSGSRFVDLCSRIPVHLMWRTNNQQYPPSNC